MKAELPDDCILCGRRMNRTRNDRLASTGLVPHGGGGQCRICYQRTPYLVERLTTRGRDSVELDVAAARERVDQLIAERRARGIPWCGVAPEPATFREERREPGRHRHTGWEAEAA